MWTSSFILRHIYSLKEGQPFTTRDCLHFGFRAAVDITLFRLVKRGVIRRLARGVFVRDPKGRVKFTDFEIAKIKAEAFGRKIAMHPAAIASELKLADDSFCEPTFSIDGRTSKFRAGDRTIRSNECCPRKMRLDQSKIGHAMRALWQMGKQSVDARAIQQVALNFNRTEKEEFMSYLRWIPAWLNDSLKFPRRWQPLPPCQ
jgi:hypothetical protein